MGLGFLGGGVATLPQIGEANYGAADIRTTGTLHVGSLIIDVPAFNFGMATIPGASGTMNGTAWLTRVTYTGGTVALTLDTTDWPVGAVRFLIKDSRAPGLINATYAGGSINGGTVGATLPIPASGVGGSTETSDQLWMVIRTDTAAFSIAGSGDPAIGKFDGTTVGSLWEAVRALEGIDASGLVPTGDLEIHAGAGSITGATQWIITAGGGYTLTLPLAPAGNTQIMWLLHFGGGDIDLDVTGGGTVNGEPLYQVRRQAPGTSAGRLVRLFLDEAGTHFATEFAAVEDLDKLPILHGEIDAANVQIVTGAATINQDECRFVHCTGTGYTVNLPSYPGSILEKRTILLQYASSGTITLGRNGSTTLNGLASDLVIPPHETGAARFVLIQLDPSGAQWATIIADTADVTAAANDAIVKRAKLATTGNITLSGHQTIDGVLTTDDVRVFVRINTDPSQNGLYFAKSGAWVRVPDMFTGGTIRPMTMVLVEQGSTLFFSLWSLQTFDPVIVGTDDQTWGPAVNNSASIGADVITATHLADNSVTTPAIADDNVTMAKLAEMAAHTLMARPENSTGNPSALAIGTDEGVFNVAGVLTSQKAKQANVENGYVDLSSTQASIAGTKTFTLPTNIAAVNESMTTLSGATGTIDGATGIYRATHLAAIQDLTLSVTNWAANAERDLFKDNAGSFAIRLIPPSGGTIQGLAVDAIYTLPNSDNPTTTTAANGRWKIVRIGSTTNFRVIAGGYVNVTDAQTIGGAKTFSSPVATSSGGTTGAPAFQPGDADSGLGYNSGASFLFLSLNNFDRLRMAASGTPTAEFRSGNSNAQILNLAGGSGTSGFVVCSGSPEGVTTATPSFVAHDVTNGRYYLKRTGTGNTGWVQIDRCESGTYTPTLGATSNLDSATPAIAYYIRVGDVVTVNGSITVDPTAAASYFFELSLPIASALAANSDLTGSAVSENGGASDCYIRAQTALDRADFACFAAGTAASILHYEYTYRVL